MRSVPASDNVVINGELPCVHTKPVPSSAVSTHMLGRVLRAGLAIAMLVGMVSVAVSGYGQTATARVLGSVNDPAHASVPGATVTVTDQQRGTTRVAKTDESGEYVMPNLAVGVYSIRVEAPGFKTVDRQSVQLEVGQDMRIDFELPIGQAEQTVTVTGATPMLDTTSITLGGTLSNKTINEIPLNGRNYENLLKLRPEMVSYPGGSIGTNSSNGMRPEDNVFLIDGLEDPEPFDGQSALNGDFFAGDATTLLPIDAIQEFNLEANPSAEYGWGTGAVVNVGLKSGTNAMHGTAYAFGRDTNFDARNYFDAVGTPKTPVGLEQYGATVGGPIVKGKLFYFGGFEALNYIVGSSDTISAPELGAQGSPNPVDSMPDAIAALVKAKVPVSPASLALAGCSVGSSTCTGGVFASNTGNSTSLVTGFTNTFTAYNAITKIDYQMNAKNSLSGFYFFGDSNSNQQDIVYVAPQYLSLFHVRVQAGDGSWTWIPNSTWVNVVHFGYDRSTQTGLPGDHATPATQLGLDTGVTNPSLGGLPYIALSGFTSLGNNKNLPKLDGPDQAYDAVDNVSWLHGKHAIKFGGEVRRFLSDEATFRTGRGYIKFAGSSAFPGASTLEDFFAGLPSQGQIMVGNPTRNIGEWSFAGFGEDDWRVSPQLTLNLGLRYEYSSVPTANGNLLGNFTPTQGLVQAGQQIGSVYKPDPTDFSPRVGLSWNVDGQGKTVIRVGASLMYSTLPFNVFDSQQNTNNASAEGLGAIPTGGTFVQANGSSVKGTGTIVANAITQPGSDLNWNGSVFANATTVTCGNGQPETGNPSVTNPAPCAILSMDRNYRTPYAANWTLNLQHAFTANLSTEIAYIGNHGGRLTGIKDINQTAVGSGWTSAAIAAGAADGNAEQLARPFESTFPFLGVINQLSNEYHSNYNALQATFNARDYHGLTFVAAYTYSHALDDASNDWNEYMPENSLNPQGEYGDSDFDLRHRFALSMTYVIPSKKTRDQSLSGWQVNAVYLVQSSAPWGTGDITDDISGTGEFSDRWDFFGNPNDFKSQGTKPLPYFAGTSNSACVNAADGVTGGVPGGSALVSLAHFGCYAKGKSVLIPPPLGTFGTLGRNVFRDDGFDNLDLSVVKTWKIGDWLTPQFRAEFFNVLNHPNFANPYGGPSDYGSGAYDDPSQPSLFGCGCATPDVAAANPVLGSGSARAIQLGLKLQF
jgi:outer membrane receptor protein involved in Fe transport